MQNIRLTYAPIPQKRVWVVWLVCATIPVIAWACHYPPHVPTRGQQVMAQDASATVPMVKPRVSSADIASTTPNVHDNALDYEDRGRTFFMRSTHLEWTKDPTRESVEWDSARSYCESLELAGGKWRVPTYKELRRLLNDRVAGNGPLFSVPGLARGDYWTSTPSEPYAISEGGPKEPSMKTVDFTWARDGSAQYMFPHHVWCMRP